jgi:exopolysaccharide biosynthesis WecB/TagA/CpsF family protein
MPFRDWPDIVERIRVLHSEQEQDNLLQELTSTRGQRTVAFVNAHAMNGAAANVDFCTAILEADLLLRDGSGMAMLYRTLGSDPGLNMNGTDFIPLLIAAYRGRKVAFWGTREPFVGQAAARCEREHGVRVVSVAQGFEDDAFYLGEAMRHKPELIVLGMGMPRQERLARELRACLGGDAVIVCGGAILDFLGGKVSRAPPWVRRAGIEWLYRLCREPRRLFRRYVVGNPSFLLRVLAWRLAGRSHRG